MKRSLPWEGVPEPIYQAREAKTHSKGVLAGGWLLVALLLMGGLMTHFKIALLFAALYAVTLVTRKTAVVTQRGVEVFYQMQITSQYDFWAWDDIFALTYELIPQYPDLMQIYFTKGDRTKRLFFPLADGKALLASAKKWRPGVKIYNGNENREKAEAAKKEMKRR